jgi:formamidopyrimidine-DNA glycosylase
MPELPEVETTRLGITPYLCNQTITAVVIRQPQLRWPIPANLSQQISGQKIEQVSRRGKYLLLHTGTGTAILHLGMSGSLRILESTTPPKKHDHIDFILATGHCLRLHDPRRFGAVLWTQKNPHEHFLLKKLGVEPLTEEFNGSYLHGLAQRRKQTVKAFIMNSQIVVGVGNIYASEALFYAGIHPQRAAGRISLARYELLAEKIKHILTNAIAQGGTTLRDFYNSAGNPGYFKQQLSVYGREGLACKNCTTPLRSIRLTQRSSVYCPNCQH